MNDAGPQVRPIGVERRWRSSVRGVIPLSRTFSVFGHQLHQQKRKRLECCFDEIKKRSDRFVGRQ